MPLKLVILPALDVLRLDAIHLESKLLDVLPPDPSHLGGDIKGGGVELDLEAGVHRLPGLGVEVLAALVRDDGHVLVAVLRLRLDGGIPLRLEACRSNNDAAVLGRLVFLAGRLEVGDVGCVELGRM